MTLTDWLTKTGTTEADFARQVGISRQVVNYWTSGRNQPLLRHMLAIERVTKGKVRIEDFVNGSRKLRA